MQADIFKLGSEQLFEKLLDYSDGWRMCSSGLERDQEMRKEDLSGPGHRIVKQDTSSAPYSPLDTAA